MPMSAVHATVNGALVEEDRGGVVTCYVPDTLGSVVATTDASGAVTSTASYWPYGEARSSTGTNPPWGFCGTWGYLKDTAARLYVRARYYRPREGRWNTQDPLWPEERAYAYADGDPVGRVDPSGLQADPLGDYCRGWDRWWHNLTNPRDCNACAVIIVTTWWFEPQHKCNAPYTHCMACCELTQRFSPKCAEDMQNAQNTTPYFKNTDVVQKRRLRFCRKGIALARLPGSCHSKCLSAYPKSRKGCTSPTPPLKVPPGAPC